MSDRIHVYKGPRGKSPCTCHECAIPRKRLCVRPELDIVISLLCDQSDFLRVEDLPQ